MSDVAGYNGESTVLVRGEVVRAHGPGNKRVVRAQANASLQGVIGIVNSGVVGPGGVVNVTVSEQASVLLDVGLTPVVGDTLYVSAVTAGRASTVFLVGDLGFAVVFDVSTYGVYSTVQAVFVGRDVAGVMGTLTFDSINLVGNLLSAFITTGYQRGTLAYVGNDTLAQTSVQDYFTLCYGEALTADGLTVVNSPTFATDGAQWKRLNTQNQRALQSNFWALDSAAGNDENSGSGTSIADAETRPLRSMAELNRRLIGYKSGETGQAVAPIISIMGDMSITDSILSNVAEGNGTGFPTVLGHKTQTGTTVVTAYAAHNPAANTGFLLSGALIGTGNLGRMVQNAAGTKTAFIDKVVSANQVRITEPSSADPITGNPGLPVAFVPGETVNIFTLPALYAWPFSGNLLFGCVGDCRILGPLTGIDSSQTNLSVSAPFAIRCILDGIITQGGEMILGCCLFSGHPSTIQGLVSSYFTSWGILGVAVLLSGGTLLLAQNLTISGAGAGLFSTDNGKILANDDTATVGVFDCTINAITVNGYSAFGLLFSINKLYGSGNSAAILSVMHPTACVLPLSGSTAVTSAPKPLVVAGTSYDYTDVPITVGPVSVSGS